MSESWKQDWQPMIDAIGTDFSKGERIAGADVIEKGLIRRFLEPLEFDCGLHYDERVAKQYGYDDIIAPYSSLLTWTLPPYWVPGKRLFDSDKRDAQPTNSPVSAKETDVAPKTSGYFWTNVEVDYIKPIVVGMRLTQVGEVLLSCIPKETSVGRGAFLVWESRVVDEDNDEVAVLKVETFNYHPHQ